MNKRKVWTTALALFLAVYMIFGMAPIQAEAASSSEIKKQINELEEQQEELEEQIAELQSQYDANADEMVDMVKQKDLIDQEIAFLHAKIDLINDQIANYSLLIADKQDELDNAETYLRELDAKYKERIQTMEEEGEVNYWSIIFDANSFSDLLD